MSDFDDAPLKYITLINFENLSTIRQEFNLANDEIVKLEIPKHNNENDEILILILREFNNTVAAYGLFNPLNATKVYDKFRRHLSGETLDTCNDIISGNTNNEVNFFSHVE